MSIRRVFSKWKKTRNLQSSSLKRYIPETVIFNYDRLGEMLTRHKMVYVKPDKGTHGNGVMRVKQHSGTSFELREGVSTQTLNSLDSLHAAIKTRIGKRMYLVQKGIHMMTHRGRKFDLRVLVQKNLDNKWESMSILGRKAAAHKIVTNVSNGGKMETLSKLLHSRLNDASIRRLGRELEQLGVSTGRELSRTYKGLKELGIDIALDKSMHPWILEVNTNPAIYVYRTFDPRAYRRICRNAKAYGRFGQK
ncbi:YheC/YheD family protein [Paenibacillus sp. OSY-SE]|uniref:YheC/YheD family protein n=1 Tax=Paenibacillus sp. OSY-SE TaxID=1196323 RepID=UPI00031EDBDB|nr:YheC/YheD family protein [Paenibacillus sp. OSY-SE]